MEEEIREAETRLVEAMTASDVVALDQLIHDRLVFIGPDGGVYRKQDDLDRHRSKVQRITELEVEQLTIEQHGSTAVTLVVARMSGSVHDQPFAGRFRYLRVWQKSDAGWQVIAGQVGSAP